MSDWEQYVSAFWEGVHERGTRMQLGDTPAFRYASYFSDAGPFADDLEAAGAVLDIGPGFGHFLASLAGKKERYAIDVSEIARNKYKAMGIQAFPPGAELPREVDLACCLSVVQHCDRSSLEVLFKDASAALRAGGRFYVNGVCGAHHTPTPEGFLHAGRFSYTQDEIRELGAKNGLLVVGEHSQDVLSHLSVWIFCFSKQ